MKPPQAVRDEMSRRKAEVSDPDLNENYRYLGESVERYRQAPQPPTQPAAPTAPKIPSGVRGSGGSAGFKTNTGRKSAVPDTSGQFNMNLYAKGGPVGRVGGFGLKRSKPDFASGGDKTNFKMNTKKGDMPW